MKYKYRYVGRGTMTFHVNDKPIIVSAETPRIGRFVELDEKINVRGMELIEDKKKTKSKEDLK